MHSNPKLFIHSLVKTGFFDIIDKSAFSKCMKDIFVRSALELSSVAQFREDLKKILKFNPKATGCKLILLGDLLADRGPNDGLILEIIYFLKKAGCHFTITLSNHDLEFLEWYYTGRGGVSGETYKSSEDYSSGDQFVSLRRFVDALQSYKHKELAKDWLHQRVQAYVEHLVIVEPSVALGEVIYAHSLFSKEVYEGLKTHAGLPSEASFNDLTDWLRKALLNTTAHPSIGNSNEESSSNEESAYVQVKDEKKPDFSDIIGTYEDGTCFVKVAVWVRGPKEKQSLKMIGGFEGYENTELPQNVSFCVHGHTDDIYKSSKSSKSSNRQYLSLNDYFGQQFYNDWVGERTIFAVPK